MEDEFDKMLSGYKSRNAGNTPQSNPDGNDVGRQSRAPSATHDADYQGRDNRHLEQNHASHASDQGFGQRDPSSRPDPNAQYQQQNVQQFESAEPEYEGFEEEESTRRRKRRRRRGDDGPKKRSKGSRNSFVIFMNFMMTLSLFAALAAGAAVYYGKAEFEKPGPLKAETIVDIPKGSSPQSIARRLHKKGIVSDETIFRYGVQASGQNRNLKAGEYAFEPGMSMRKVMETLTSGKAILYGITIPEGLTTEQIMARISADEILTGDMPETPAEGSLLPDTYKYGRGMSRSELVEQMKKAQEKLLAEVWSKRIDGLPVKTPQEMVTLASIVEKETGKADERPRVAGVFVNRLNKGIRLQSDPTIIYGIYGGTGKPKGKPIYKSDIKKKTPYNTYIIDGLPPGPIANPGRASLEAVANPIETDEVYFVADGTGGHVFAKTLKEHNANVRKWRAIEKKRAKEAAEKAKQEATQSESN